MGIPSSHRVHCGNLNKGKVSVVIPVRDEETTSDGCLASLRTRRHTDLEIMVVDDASTDRTVEIVQHHVDADPRVRLVRTDGPPPGWAGKVCATCRGVAETTGDWLFFVDSDTESAPDLIGKLLAAAESDCRTVKAGSPARSAVPKVVSLRYVGRA